VGSEARLRSAELLLGRIHSVLVQGTDVLLMGDLNAMPDDPALRVLDQLLLNACPEEQGATGTYNGFGRQPPPLPRIDHVLITPTRWRIVGYAVPHPLVNGREVSDHYPLVVTLTR
jgi:endonuclease/exonuclease/phosphatase family metal-dependent hydrolase